ncbi:MAG: TRAP transporter substrate-binding protein [Planctomycetota bacterium]
MFGVTAVQADEFRSSDLRDASNPSVQAVAYLGKLVRERTGGRHTIKVQQATATDDFTIQQIRNGNLAMARVGIAAFHNLVPATVVPSLPFVFKSKAHQRAVLDGPIGEEILADMESEGFIGLGFYDVGARSFYSVKKPIRNAADMKGMSVRVQSGDILAPLLRVIGAIPQPIPYLRLYDSLKVGAVDAGEFDLPTYEASRYYEVAKFYSLTEHNRTPSILVFSKKIWDGLSDEDKTIIRNAAKESVIYHREVWDEYEPSARKAAEAAGMKIIVDVDRKSFSDVMVPARTKFATNPRQKELLNRIMAGSST